MKTLFRSLAMLAVAVWLGGLLYFPIIAQIAFSTLSDKHAAGQIVGSALRVLHYEGLVCGALLVLLIAVAHMARIFRRTLFGAFATLVIMAGLTAYSQFSILPRMEAYRIAGGGDVSALAAADPNAVGFDRLHKLSVTVEEGVMAAGLLLVVSLAWAESGGPRR